MCSPIRSLVLIITNSFLGFSGGASHREPPANAGDLRTQVQSLGREDPLEEEMITHSSALARKIPRTEEPGGLQSLGLQRVAHD